jgi:hypothetical protein
VSSAEAWPNCDASRTRQRVSLRKKIELYPEGTENTQAIYSTLALDACDRSIVCPFLQVRAQQLGQGPTT